MTLGDYLPDLEPDYYKPAPKKKEKSVKERILVLSILLALLFPLMLFALGIYVTLAPDEITTIYHPSQPAYETYEHSRDGAGVFFGAGIFLAIGAFVWIALSIDEFKSK